MIPLARFPMTLLTHFLKDYFIATHNKTEKECGIKKKSASISKTSIE